MFSVLLVMIVLMVVLKCVFGLMIVGDLLLSLSVMGVRLFVVVCIMWWLICVELVNNR